MNLFSFFSFLILWGSCFRPMGYTKMRNTHTILLHQRSGPMASVPTINSGPPPLYAAATPAAATAPTINTTSAAVIPAGLQHLVLSICHPKRAQIGGDIPPTLAALIPGSTATHTNKVNAAATSVKILNPRSEPTSRSVYLRFYSGRARARTSSAACVMEAARSVFYTPTTTLRF